MTLFAGDEDHDDDVTSGPVDGWLGEWDEDPADMDWTEVGPDEPPPGWRVVVIETTGEWL